MKKYLFCALLVLGVSCATSEDLVPDIIVVQTETTEKGSGREFIDVDLEGLGSGWLLAIGQGGDSLFVRYTDKVDTMIYSPAYLHVPDTLESIVNDLNAFKVRARWDMLESNVDTIWIKEFTIYWADSTYSWYSLMVTDGFAYPEELMEDLKLQVL